VSILRISSNPYESPYEESGNEINTITILSEAVSIVLNSEYGEYINLKGGLALLAALETSQKSYLSRLTTDIDLDVQSKEIWEEFVANFEKLLNMNSKLGLTYKINSRRGFEKNAESDSIRISVSKEQLVDSISIDMNIRPKPKQVKYLLPKMDIEIYASALEYMLSDKLVVLSDRKICRRIKDFYDIYVICQLKNFNMTILVKEFNRYRGLSCLPDNGLYFTNKDSVEEMKHAYEKFEGILNKPEFNELYAAVSNFTLPIYASIYSGINECENWLKDKMIWE